MLFWLSNASAHKEMREREDRRYESSQVWWDTCKTWLEALLSFFNDTLRWTSENGWSWGGETRDERDWRTLKKRSSEIMTCDGKSATRFVIIWNGQASKKIDEERDDERQLSFIKRNTSIQQRERDQELGKRRLRRRWSWWRRRLRHLTWHYFFSFFIFCLWSLFFLACLELWDLVMSSRKTLYGNLSTKKDDEIQNFVDVTLPSLGAASFVFWWA